MKNLKCIQQKGACAQAQAYAQRILCLCTRSEVQKRASILSYSGASIVRRRSSQGMTLIEILIVLSLIALLFGSMTFGSGIFTSGNKRAAASLIVAGVRKGLSCANTSGRPCRLALNFDTGSVILEEAVSRGALRKSEKEAADSIRDAVSNYGPSAEEIVNKAEQAATDLIEGNINQSPDYRSVADWVDEDGQPGRSIGRGILFRMVQTEHDEEPIVEGVAYLHFWPGGETERAVVQLGSKDLEDAGYSIMISALTGRARIEKGRKELELGRFSDEEYSEREAL